MKAAIFKKPGVIAVEERNKPTIENPGDAVVRIVRTCVCGSDLWWYRGIDSERMAADSQIGHEGIGVVDAVGTEVTAFMPGDFVIIPFGLSCGTCANCRAGRQTNCTQGTWLGNSQSEYAYVPLANGSLTKIPDGTYTEEQLASLLTLSDVMGTGYHAAVSAGVKPGDAVAVVGDGAVGLCGVIAAKMLGAKRIVAMSRHADRQALAREFGATDIVAERGDEGVAKAKELTEEGVGFDAVLECVGSDLSMQTAIKLARPGAMVGTVGVPHDVNIPFPQIFFGSVGIHGGPAPSRAYADTLLQAVLAGEINPGKVFTLTTDLDHIADAYAAMNERRAIKSLVKVSEL